MHTVFLMELSWCITLGEEMLVTELCCITLVSTGLAGKNLAYKSNLFLKHHIFMFESFTGIKVWNLVLIQRPVSLHELVPCSWTLRL